MKKEKIDQLIDEINKFFNGKDVGSFLSYFPSDINLFLVSEKRILRVHHEDYISGYGREDFSLFLPLSYSRGYILEAFSKLEYFINEIIKVCASGGLLSVSHHFDDVLEKVEFYGRIKLLIDWGVLNKSTEKYFMPLKKVRNELAHKWQENKILYKKMYLNENMECFKNDLRKIWEILLDAYSNQILEPEIDKWLETIKGYHHQGHSRKLLYDNPHIS